MHPIQPEVGHIPVHLQHAATPAGNEDRRTSVDQGA